MKKNMLILQHFNTDIPAPMAPCKDHPESESFYFCLDDQHPFCARCATKHKKHDFYDIDDEVITQGTDKKLQVAKAKAIEMLSAAKIQHKAFIDIYSQLEIKKASAKLAFEASFAGLINALQAKKEGFLASLNSPILPIVEEIQSHVENLALFIGDKENSLEKVDAINKEISKRAGQERLKYIEQLESINFTFDDKSAELTRLQQQLEFVNLEFDIDFQPLLEAINNLQASARIIKESDMWKPPGAVVQAPIYNPAMVDLVELLSTRPIQMSEKIKHILMSTDRKDFMPLESSPYEDRPQRIGFNTTISAPHMHAITMGILEPFLRPDIKVLDIGCGSGYLTICMAKFIESGTVIGVDHIEELINQAVDNIQKNHQYLLSENNLEIHMIHRDGRLGLEELAPFDVIHIGAATTSIPPPLLAQLKCGGILVAPVGPLHSHQSVTIIEKNPDGTLNTKLSIPVNYAPLTDRERQCPQ